jgi:hypothetical protein
MHTRGGTVFLCLSPTLCVVYDVFRCYYGAISRGFAPLLRTHSYQFAVVMLPGCQHLDSTFSMHRPLVILCNVDQVLATDGIAWVVLACIVLADCSVLCDSVLCNARFLAVS